MLNIAPETLLTSFITIQQLDVSGFRKAFEALSTSEKLHLIESAAYGETVLKREIGRLNMEGGATTNAALLGVVHTTLSVLGELVTLRQMSHDSEEEPLDAAIRMANISGEEADVLKEVLQSITKPTGADAKMVASLAVEAGLGALRNDRKRTKKSKRFQPKIVHSHTAQSHAEQAK